MGAGPPNATTPSSARLTSHTGLAVPATLNTGIETGRERARASTGGTVGGREHTRDSLSHCHKAAKPLAVRGRGREGVRGSCTGCAGGACPHLSVLLAPHPPLTITLLEWLWGQEVPQHLGTAATVASLPSQGMGGFGTVLLFGIRGGEISTGLSWAPSGPWSSPCSRSYEENSPRGASTGQGSTHC